MFLRYESFREYLRLYPVNTVVLALLAAAHAGFALYALMSGVPAWVLKQEYGAFLLDRADGTIPEYWRYIASVFLHADFGHLLFNAFAIFVFAPPLERALGSFRYGALFLFSGVMGNIFTNFYAGPVASVGASGAVYGVFGAYVFYMLFRRGALDFASKRTLQTMLIVGVLYAIAIPQINYFAHLGGFVGGLVMNALYTWVLQGRTR